MKRLFFLTLTLLFLQVDAADRVTFTRQRLFPGFDGKTCKIQPTVATDGKGTVLLTWQHLLLTGSDVFYGESMARSTDGGKSFSPGKPLTVLKDTWEGKIRTARYANVFFGKKHGRWFGLGAGQLFANDKEPMSGLTNGKPTLFPIYCTVDPEKGEYVTVERLDVPFAYSGAMPFGQILEEENGDLLIPFYARPPDKAKNFCLIVRYRFAESGLVPVKAGTPIVDDSYPRGICEPSLAKLGGKYYVTLRTDIVGLWAESDDGLSFSKPKPWTWDDGSVLENYNTQQHWMRPDGALYLAYTRCGAQNDHVFRHRAPIFMSKFDPVRGCLVRATEMTLVPELGARLGNFNAIEASADEAWLVTAEWMQSWRGHNCADFGSDNSIWLVKARFLVEDPAKTKGTLCLAFRGRDFETWKRAIPLFEKYGARATFFVDGKITGAAYETMNRLCAKGHSIGLGDRTQLDAARAEGYFVRAFASPDGAYDADMEAALERNGFVRRRGEVAMSEMQNEIRKLAERHESVAFDPVARFDVELETLLQTARSCGVRMIGLDEIEK